jgi:beta-propeller uncharacterized protein DUF5122
MRRRLALIATATLVLLAGPASALATGSQSAVVSADPVDWTPNVLDGTVYAVAVVGDEVVVGGDFTQVRPADGGTTLHRGGLFAFQLGTGAISAQFAPRLDGTVYGLAAGPDGTVYAGGSFTQVDGAAHPGVARLDVASGTPTAGFDSTVDGGTVSSVVAHGGAVYLGGNFTGVDGTGRPAVARISGTSGALDAGFDARVAKPRSGRLRAIKLALTNDGTTLALAGTFTRVGGQDRTQLALVSAASGAVRGWRADAYQQNCDPSYNTYLRGIDFAPNGSYLVVVTTGHESDPHSMCDAAARFDTAGTGNHPPVWVNRTGGNSLFSVAATGAAVYVGGHEQWLDNPQGNKSAGPGAVSRPGIGAIDPKTGKALSWNPTRERGVGVQDMVTYPAGTGYPAGLLVGSDTDQLGHEYHARIGAFPLS